VKTAVVCYRRLVCYPHITYRSWPLFINHW